MILNEENYIEKINAMTKQNWLPLMELIQDIESCEKYDGEDELTQILDLNNTAVFSRFHNLVYDLSIIISFDWMSWDEGRNIVSNENFDFNTIDIPTKCKIITVIVRSDRFCHGELEAAFQSGVILKILKSIEFQIE